MAWGQVDSVMKVIHSLPDDTIRLNELLKWCERTIDTPDELIYLDTLLSEAARQGNIDCQALAYRNKVRHYFNLNKLENAQLASESAICFLRMHHKNSLLFDVKSMLINMYTNREEYEISLWKGHEMYKEAEQLNDQRGKISACYVLAYACYASKRNEEAIGWCRRGIDLALNLSGEASMEVAEFYFMLAESYYNQKKMDSVGMYVDSVYTTLSAYTQAHSKSITEHYSFYELWLYCRYADGCLNRKDLKGAKANLEKASLLLEQYKYDIYLDLYYYTCSDYHLAAGEYEQAMEALEKGRKYELGWLSGESPEYQKKRAKIYYAKGDYRIAAEKIRQSFLLADSLDKVRFTEQSRQLRNIYDMNRLEEESEEQIFIIHVQIILVISLSVAIFSLFYYLFRFYRMKQELAEAVEKACREDEKTSGFLHNMSREVQVFLEDITNLSDALISEPETGKKQEYATQICNRNERAQRVIFDILDVSKIESGRMQFQYEEISLGGLAEEVCSNILQNLPKEVKFRLLPCEEMLFTTDPVRLSRALFNLLHYAVSHTDGGCIYFNYEKRDKDVRFVISGDSWSMSQEEYLLLFDRLAQTTGRLENMKLEMLISRGLIIKMNGSLTVFPDLSGKTKFEFILPDHSLKTDTNKE